MLIPRQSSCCKVGRLHLQLRDGQLSLCLAVEWFGTAATASEGVAGRGRGFPALLRGLLEVTHPVDLSKFSGDQPRTPRGASLGGKLLRMDEQRNGGNLRLTARWPPGSSSDGASPAFGLNSHRSRYISLLIKLV